MTHTPDLAAAPELPALASPRIAVVICNYNYERFIDQAIGSVLSQTRPADELIVVDDGSTDGSVDRVARFAAAGVRLIRQANGGQVAAYNAGMAACSADVVLFLDSDDALLPDALAQVAGAFGQGVAKVHFRLRLIGPDGEPLGGSIPRDLADGDVAPRLLRHGVAHASPPASGNAYRRSVLQRLFPLPVDAVDRHGADFFCIYGSSLFGRLASLPQPLGLYRVHRLGPSRSGLNFGNAAEGLELGLRSQRRFDRLRACVAVASAGRWQLPAQMLDFSLEKNRFATAVLDPARGRRVAAREHLVRLLRAARWRTEAGVFRRCALAGWALAVLLAPRAQALALARAACDPAARVPGPRGPGAQPARTA